MLCFLPPTRVALGHLPAERLPDASSLFNLMRNLGGAIGIALIDTVIWSRAPLHADELLTRLRAGDLDVARSIGIPEVYLSGGQSWPTRWCKPSCGRCSNAPVWSRRLMKLGR